MATCNTSDTKTKLQKEACEMKIEKLTDYKTALTNLLSKITPIKTA